MSDVTKSKYITVIGTNIWKGTKIELKILRESEKFYFTEDCPKLGIKALTTKERTSGHLVWDKASNRRRYGDCREYRILTNELKEGGVDKELLNPNNFGISKSFKTDVAMKILEQNIDNAVVAKVRGSNLGYKPSFKDIESKLSEELQALDTIPKPIKNETKQVSGLVASMINFKRSKTNV